MTDANPYRSVFHFQKSVAGYGSRFYVSRHGMSQKLQSTLNNAAMWGGHDRSAPNFFMYEVGLNEVEGVKEVLADYGYRQLDAATYESPEFETMCSFLK